ncbi:hypothetical protein MRZ76_01075 [bacterium]|nr:hypothetical protein [bacterium]
MKKKIIAWALLGLALASCGDNPASSSEVGSDSLDSETSSVNGSNSESGGEDISVAPSKQRVEMDVVKTVIPEGTCFFDAAKPTVNFIDEEAGTTEDVTNYTFQTTFTITDKNDAGKTYKAGDLLPKGSYTAKARYKKARWTDTVDFTVQEQNVEKASEGKGYHTATVESLAPYTYQNYSGIETLGGSGMPSSGNVNILVIPVQFNNAKFSDASISEQQVRDVLQEAFFAENENGEDTPWESLHSYYKKASFGRLNIGGDVSSIVTYNADDSNLDGNNTGLAQTITLDAIKQLEAKGELDPTKYDANKDGYIDGIEVVYFTSQSIPDSGFGTSDSSGDLWWNFTTNVPGAKNVKNPGARRIFWSRWDFLTNTYYSSYKNDNGNPIGNRIDGKAVDAHTIIHETGHMMGAPDYYSYDKDEGPAGCVDMMDQNVGDHNAYTKMAYNWIAPMVIDGSSNNFEITLPSYTDTGKFLLLKNTTTDPWNGTPYDEYLLLEYYTPTGVNQMDSTGYPEWSNATSSSGGSAYGHGGTYEHAGLQVFHVDARVGSEKGTLTSDGKIDLSTGVLAYTDTPKAADAIDSASGTFETSATLYASNTKSASGRASQEIKDGATESPTALRHLKIVTPSGIDSFAGSTYYSTMGNMSNIFGTGEYCESWGGDPKADDGNKKYGGSSYSNFAMSGLFMNGLTFNDGSYLNWNWEITGMTDDSVTLHFVNIA